jgi:hypothetical protein
MHRAPLAALLRLLCTSLSQSTGLVLPRVLATSLGIPPHLSLTRHCLPSTTRDSPSCPSPIARAQHLEFKPIFEGGRHPSAEAAKSNK